MPDMSDIQKRYPLLFDENNNLTELRLKRYQLAWQEAKRVSAFLKSNFSAKKILLFGSIIDPDRFDENSDIDLAVSGIPDEKFYAAVGAVTRIVENFEIDIIDIDDCRDHLKKTITEEGIEI